MAAVLLAPPPRGGLSSGRAVLPAAEVRPQDVVDEEVGGSVRPPVLLGALVGQHEERGRERHIHLLLQRLLLLLLQLLQLLRGRAAVLLRRQLLVHRR